MATLPDQNVFISDEPILISADRIKTTKERSSVKSLYFNQEEISQSQNINDLFKSNSEINIIHSGPSGGAASLFIRGQESSHLLVIIDGIVMNDPSNPNRQFDFARLSLNNIEKIELLKGSQGLLYGSNAIGGVLLLTTKLKSKKPFVAEINLGVGTHQTQFMGLNFQKNSESADFSLGLDQFKTTGFSAANKDLNPNSDEDGEKRLTLQTSTELKFKKDHSLKINYRLVNDNTELDKGGGANNDDPNDYQTSQEQYGKINYLFNDNLGDGDLSITHSKHHRILNEVKDHLNNNQLRSVNKGQTTSYNFLHDFYFFDHIVHNLNIQSTKEKDQSQNKTTNNSLALYNKIESEDQSFNFGLRIDQHNLFNEHFTYKLSYQKKISKLKIKANYSTGYRSPSLNQLFDPLYGNNKLSPELSNTSEIELETPIYTNFNWITSIFNTNLKNRLSYHPITFVNTNSGKSRVYGIESNLDYFNNKNFKSSLSSTFLNATDLEKNEKLPRRPSFISILTNSFLNEKSTFELVSTFKGKTSDVDNQGRLVKLPSYFIHHFNYFYQLQEKIRLKIELKNLLNKKFEETYGYGTAGRTIYLEGKITF